ISVPLPPGRCSRSRVSRPSIDAGHRDEMGNAEVSEWLLTPEEWTVITLSLRIALWAVLGSLPFGLFVAWLLARKRFWGHSLLNGLVHLPLILPPVVTGYLLLLFFGRRGHG